MSAPVRHRSEIVFVVDAEACNPNGDPLSENRPRIDPVTRQAAITDVRLKRYLRDQLAEDGHGVFVRQSGNETGTTRAQLALDVLEEIQTVRDLERVDDVETTFLERATDVRYFGAVLSFNRDADDPLHEAIRDAFDRGSYTGPVQFSPARSLNEVQMNEATKSLTSVIASSTDSDSGGFALNDYRITYGIFPFHGLVSARGAADTNLTARDVERLDTLCWRALKNQTVTRSKFGQEPRLYVRIEYDRPGYHDGGIHNCLALDRETMDGGRDEALRDVTDVCLDVTDFVDRLEAIADRIETVHVVGDDYLSISYGGEHVGVASDLPTLLEAHDFTTHEIDVYEEFTETLPSESDGGDDGE